MVRRFCLWSGLGMASLVLVGCSGSTTGKQGAAEVGQPALPKALADAQPGEHAHKPGGHGGNIVEVGRDNYHAEPVFEKDGTLRLYLLGKDEAKVQEAESQVLTAYVKPDGGMEATAIKVRPVPQAGDSEGRTSQFVAKLPKELVGKKVEVTVPSITIDGARYRFGF